MLQLVTQVFGYVTENWTPPPPKKIFVVFSDKIFACFLRKGLF